MIRVTPNLIKSVLCAWLALASLLSGRELVLDCSSLADSDCVIFCDFMNFVITEQGADYAEEHQPVLKILFKEFLVGVEPREKPIMLVVCGPAGAGKTTYRRNHLEQKGWHVHDLDEVMARLPEYKVDSKKDGPKLAFEKWLLPARNMSRLLLKFAIKSKMNVIYDRTCGHISSFDDITFVKQQGYYIKLIGLFIEFPAARQRVLTRELQGEHGMPESILIESCGGFSALWPYYLPLADEAYLYDVAREPFELIFSSRDDGGNAELYQKFLKLGDSLKEFFATKIAHTDGRQKSI